MIQLEVEKSLDIVLIEETVTSFSKINNAAQNLSTLVLPGLLSKTMLINTSVFNSATINENIRRDHDSFRHTETRVLKSFEYQLYVFIVTIIII